MRGLYAEVRAVTAPPGPGRQGSTGTAAWTGHHLDGAGILRGDLTPELSGAAKAGLDAYAAPGPGPMMTDLRPAVPDGWSTLLKHGAAVPGRAQSGRAYTTRS